MKREVKVKTKNLKQKKLQWISSLNVNTVIYDSESSQNTIQTQEQAIDESNNSKDTQYNQNSNTT